MMMRKPLKFLVFGCSFLALTLGGCSALPGGKTDEETLVASGDSGGYRQIDQSQGLSPEELHARARAQVHPQEMVQHNQYVKTVDEIEREHENHNRVVAMERDVDVVKTQFKGLKDTVETAEARSPAFQNARIEPAAAGTSVQHVRFGAHPGKVRMVFDLNAPSGVQYDLDNKQNLLIVRLPGAKWNTKPEEAFNNGKVLRGYAAKTTEEGDALVVVKLKGPSKVLTSQKLGKNEQGYYRVFLDIAPL